MVNVRNLTLEQKRNNFKKYGVAIPGNEYIDVSLLGKKKELVNTQQIIDFVNGKIRR